MKRHQLASAVDLGFVFLGRGGGIAATLFFIPRYHDLLTPSAFGVVAIILSLQSLFLTFDLGMSTIVGTEIAAAQNHPERIARALTDWRHSEGVLLALAVVSVCLALLIRLLPGMAWQLHGREIGLIGVLIAGLLLANVAHTGLNAVNRYRTSTMLMVGGTLARGLAALALMTSFSASVESFLAAQAAVVVIHVGLARLILARSLRRDAARSQTRWNRASLARVLRRSKPLILYSLAGAAAIQLDKFIVAGFFSLQVAGDYYLAATYALTPIAVLGGPIYQYFLPKVAGARDQDHELVAHRFTFFTVAAIVAPTSVLIIFADVWLALWMPHATNRASIEIIAQVLIFGAALGGTGYYPTALFIGTRREAIVTRISIFSSITVLAAALLASAAGSIITVALVYALYYIAVSVALWLRARPSRDLLSGSYLGPLIALTSGCAMMCIGLRSLLSPTPAAFAAAVACSVLTLIVALAWWRRYGRPAPAFAA